MSGNHGLQNHTSTSLGRIAKLPEGLPHVPDEALDRLKMLELLNELSHQLLCSRFDHADVVIESTLGMLGRFAHADRAYVFMFRERGTLMDNTHEWCEEGILPQKDRIQSLPVRELPWWTEQIRHRDCVWIPKVSELPSEAALERYEFEAQNIISLIAVPLLGPEGQLGFVGFDSVGKSAEWDGLIPDLLKAGAALLTSVLTRDRAERDLAERELRFRTILHVSPNLMAITRRQDGVILELNDNYVNLLGIPREELIGKDTVAIGFWPSEEERARFLEAIDTHGKVEGFECRLRSHTGEERTILMGATRLFLEGEVQIVSEGVDITDRDLASTKLRELEERFHLALKASKAGMWDFKIQEETSYVDERYAEILGYRHEEVNPVTKASFKGLVHPHDYAEFERLISQHLAGASKYFEASFRMRSKSGNWVWILGRGSVVEWDAKGNAVRMAGTHTDITEFKQMEANLIQAQKMDSVGRLAGGVAHDFNNLLTVIHGHGDMLLAKSLNSAQRDNVDAILAASERAQALTRQLLMFSRKHDFKPCALDLNQVIRESMKMYRRLISEDIFTSFEAEGTLPQILADPQQIDQILANLLVNARDAIHAGDQRHGARITVRTFMERITSTRRANQIQVEQGDWVCIQVRDTGCGMDDTTLNRIFEPFFSTKREGEGTGLGLATVYGIVKQNNGGIQVQSSPGQGATFTIYWKAEFSKESSKASPVGNSMKKGSERVLLVEDQAEVRDITQRGLSIMGYEVISFALPMEALEWQSTCSEQPDLLLTDLVMPGMNGLELSKTMQERLPGLKVIHMSGYTDDVIEGRGMLRDQFNYLRKPFTLAKLSETVRSVLDGQSAKDAS